MESLIVVVADPVRVQPGINQIAAVAEPANGSSINLIATDTDPVALKPDVSCSILKRTLALQNTVR